MGASVSTASIRLALKRSISISGTTPVQKMLISKRKLLSKHAEK